MSAPPSTSKTRFIEFLKASEIPGAAFLAYVVEHWGWGSLLFLVVGFLIGWTWVWWGYAPGFLVGSYRTPTHQRGLSAKPQSLEVAPADAPEWLQPQVSWLEDEGESIKKQGNINGYQICTVTTEMPKNAGQSELEFPSFEWELKADRDCEVKGFAFKQNVEQFQPLDLARTSGQSTPDVIRFIVPRGTLGGEKLVALIRLSWKTGTPATDCKNAFRSRAL
jgi:hypothetical protein